MDFQTKLLYSASVVKKIVKQVSTSARVSSQESSRPPFEVNRRVVQAFLSIGKGLAGMEQFCIAMGMNGMSNNSYNAHLLKICDENKTIKENLLENSHAAIRQAHIESDPTLHQNDVINNGVSYNGM